MDWPPHVKVRNVDTFFAALHTAVTKAIDWNSPQTKNVCADRFFAAVYIGHEFIGDDLAVVFRSCHDAPGRIQFTMHAKRWGDQPSLATDKQYSRAERLVDPLFEIVGNILRYKIRILRPKDKRRPLRGSLAQAFEQFSISATNTWTGHKAKALHPLERKKFWHFVRVAHQYSSILRPDDVRFHLRHVGFSTAIANELSEEYATGRRILAMHYFPWNIREEKRKAKKRRQKEDELDFERVYGRPKRPDVTES
ncbi:MAG: hypothetical protein DHS20C16_12370 [Phycisphaerae bacterium]|nr:MAG: hypothetical protein DHS20C16_12370 [Phycisphaerae bacterium]